MILKNDVKFEKELTCQFKIDMRNLTNFDQLKNLKNLYFNELFLTKVYNVWAKKSVEELCFIFIYRLKNSDFILEGKIAEQNQIKNSKQPDRPHTVWKLYFNLKINE